MIYYLKNKNWFMTLSKKVYIVLFIAEKNTKTINIFKILKRYY